MSSVGAPATEDPSAVYAAAVALHRQGREAEAEGLYRRLLLLAPGHPEVQNLLGVALLALGRATEAEPMLAAAAAADPSRPDFHANLANARASASNAAAAAGGYRHALALAPGLAAAWLNLANVSRTAGRLDDSVAAYRRGLSLSPDDAPAQGSLGGVLYESGLPAEALAAYRRSLALAFHPTTHSGYLYLLEFDAEASPATHQRERRRWAAMHQPASAARLLPDRTADPERALTVGFLAPSFEPGNALMIEPYFTARRRDAFRCVAFSNDPPSGESAQRLARLADAWETLGALPDERVAERIRDRRIDILVDTANHIGGHRLGVFARRPAPVQVSGWSHGIGTGLRDVDYLIADPVVIPAGERRLYSETVIDVACRPAFPPPPASPPVAPADLGRPFAYGHLGRLAKVTDDVVDLWADLLGATPDARLVIKSGSTGGLDRVLRRLARAGVGIERIDVLGLKSRFDTMADYRLVDLALDTAPVSGPLTLWEAIWMGVPALVLAGATQSARSSMSVLTAAGMTEFIAADRQSYVAIGRSLAADRPRLAALRATLRDRLARSPAGNSAMIAAEMERAFREMWRRWCARRTG